MGSKEWLRLFALVSSEISIAEGCELVPNTPTCDQERGSEIRDLTNKLKAIETLFAYRATVRYATGATQKRKAKYFLVEYDHKTN